MRDRQMLGRDPQIQREIQCFLDRYHPEPRVFIGYERVAMKGKRQPELRITFNRNLRWRTKALSLQDGDAGMLLLPGGEIVMEIKIMDAVPLWLASILSQWEIYPAGFSKYGTCYLQHIAAHKVQKGKNDDVEQYYDNSTNAAGAAYMSDCGYDSGRTDSNCVLYNSRHSAGFALTLALLPMTVAVVIMMVNGNIGTGVVVAGAFALVRFRSVPGTAREIAAIFVDMALGLALGMGYVGLAVVFFLMTALFTLLLTKIDFGGRSRNEKKLRVTIPENLDYNGLFDEIFEKHNVRWNMDRVRTTNMGTLFEIVYHVEFPGSHVPKEFIDELRARNGNLNIVCGAIADKEMM